MHIDDGGGGTSLSPSVFTNTTLRNGQGVNGISRHLGRQHQISTICKTKSLLRLFDHVKARLAHHHVTLTVSHASQFVVCETWVHGR